MAAPGTPAIWLRITFWAVSFNCVSDNPPPFNVTRQTGRLEESSFRTNGGSVPGGRWLISAMARLAIVVTAESALVPGWK